MEDARGRDGREPSLLLQKLKEKDAVIANLSQSLYTYEGRIEAQQTELETLQRELKLATIRTSIVIS